MGAYYAIMSVAHLFARQGLDLALLFTATTVTAATAFGAAARLRRHLDPAAIDAMVLMVNALVVANVQLSLAIVLDPNKLIYFVLMTMVFGMTGMSLRQAIPGIALALACLFTTVAAAFPDLLTVYAFMAIAAVFSSLGTVQVLRRAFARAVAAQHAAERREHEARRLAAIAREQADTDSLTEIANRRSFFDMLEQGVPDAAPGRFLCMIAIDLDGFKPVNDHYGHRAGDLLLKTVARRLRDAVPAPARVARIGGDEFMVMLTTADRVDEPLAVCERARAAMVAPIPIGADMVQIGASVGCAVDEVARADSSGLAEQADFALYHAKRFAKGQAVIFSNEHAAALSERVGIDQALRRGDLDRELSVVFQPQWDLASGRLVGAEALVRWNSVRLGPIAPDRFIPLAEQSGLIGDITRIVVRKALHAAAGWPVDWSVSINISAHDLLSDTTIAEVVAITAVSGIAPERIEFEITETAMVTDLDRALRHLALLIGQGHRIALDDFGAGYSNFGHLSRLPVSKLKIDRSFVRAWNDDGHTSKLIKTMIDMGRVLNIDCVLEGLETQEQLELARASGATIVQGYLLGPPMTSQDLMLRFATSIPQRKAS